MWGTWGYTIFVAPCVWGTWGYTIFVTPCVRNLRIHNICGTVRVRNLGIHNICGTVCVRRIHNICGTVCARNLRIHNKLQSSLCSANFSDWQQAQESDWIRGLLLLVHRNCHAQSHLQFRYYTLVPRSFQPPVLDLLQTALPPTLPRVFFYLQLIKNREQEWPGNKVGVELVPT